MERLIDTPPLWFALLARPRPRSLPRLRSRIMDRPETYTLSWQDDHGTQLGLGAPPLRVRTWTRLTSLDTARDLDTTTLEHGVAGFTSPGTTIVTPIATSNDWVPGNLLNDLHYIVNTDPSLKRTTTGTNQTQRLVTDRTR